MTEILVLVLVLVLAIKSWFWSWSLALKSLLTSLGYMGLFSAFSIGIILRTVLRFEQGLTV